MKHILFLFGLFASTLAAQTQSGLPGPYVSAIAQAANCILSGPASGGNAAPTCRALVTADFPNTLTPTFTSLSFLAGGTIASADTGTPTLTWSANLITASKPFAAPSLLSGTPTSAAQAALPTGAHGVAGDETSTAGVPASAVDYLRFDSGSHRIKQSVNNGAEVNVPIPSEIPAAQVAANLASSGSTGVTGTLPTGNLPASISITSILAGQNLTSNCATIPALCFDAAGVARPASGAWDIGAYQYVASGINGSFFSGVLSGVIQ